MSEVIPVCIPQETVNDDLVLIQQWKVADGQAVSSGQILVEVETSKSVFEITSPADGFVRLNAASDQEVPIGKVLCYIGATLEAVDSRLRATAACDSTNSVAFSEQPNSLMNPSDLLANVQKSAVTVPFAPLTADDSSQPAQSTRFSRQAMELIQQLGLSTTEFTSKGLIRSEDILRLRNVALSPVSVAMPMVESSVKAPSQFRTSAGVPYQSQQLARSKKLETRVLAWSTLQAIRSSVTVIVPTVGRNRLQDIGSDAAENVTANLIHSCAVLLRQFPLLNACCIDDQVMTYNQVNIGYAMDAGRGLKVAVLRDADTKTVSSIAENRQRLISAYLSDSLLPADLAGATFTITDLSGSGVTTFDPLISEGQAGILGISGEFPIGGDQQAYHLVLSFDHRLVEGRAAAIFLNKLKELVVAFEGEILRTISSISGSSELCCARCGISLADATQRNHFLVQVADARASHVAICTICLQGR